ncbi:chemotaxis protein CheD [Anaerotignum faecicola]
MNKTYVVGIADMKICRSPGVLVTYALGSCIGVCVYDPVIRLAGMVHIMLPNMYENNKDNIFKYADTGIPETIRKMEAFGGVRSRMVCKIAGGAKMFELKGNGTLGNIGARNAESVKAVLMKERVRIVKEDLGSNYARTMYFDSSNGEATIKSYGKPEKKL